MIQFVGRSFCAVSIKAGLGRPLTKGKEVCEEVGMAHRSPLKQLSGKCWELSKIR